MNVNQIVFSDEITLWWDKEWDCSDAISYRACLSGGGCEMEKHPTSTHVTFASLTPNTGYEIALFRIEENGAETSLVNLKVQTKEAKKRIDVTKAPYSCVGDGQALNTHALQRALDDCTPDACVYFPAGVYLSGALTVHSDTEIYLDEGATLQGSARAEDYLPRIKSRFEGLEMECYSSLLNMGTLDHASGANCRNIVIRGKGAILGGGLALCNEMIFLPKTRRSSRPARTAIPCPGVCAIAF